MSHVSSTPEAAWAASRSLHETFPATDAAHVLLVQGNGRPGLRGLRLSLQREGYTVTEVGWVAELFDYLREPLCGCGRGDIPDLIVADLDAMGSHDAFKVLADVCRAGASTRLILLSFRPDPELRRRADQLPSTYLLTQPCSVEDVRDLALSLIRPC